MSLRAAKFGDHWRAAFARDYPERVSTIALQNLRFIADVRLNIGPGIVAVVGGNGVGKSTLAQAIAEGLSDQKNIPEVMAQQRKIQGSIIEFSFLKNGGEKGRKVSFEEDMKVVEGAETVVCFWLDPSLFSTMCRQQVCGDKFFAEEVLEGLGAQEFGSDEVALASYIVGKDYESCEIWEVAEYGPFEIWPYFQVKANGITYRSEDMGQGELALLSAMWAIRRCPDNAFIVIEEPETHVSSRSQLAFMDLLAKECATRAITFMVTTHSAVILQRIPAVNTFLLVGSRAQSELIPNPHMHHIASLVGGGVSYKALLLVEDMAAKMVCVVILAVLAPDLARQVVFSVARRGESEIVKILTTMPRVEGWGMLVGCFDGDQRAKHSQLTVSWPYVFLPGTDAPDKLLWDSLKGTPLEEVVAELRVDKSDWLVAVAAAEGTDHHDWGRHVSVSLNIEAEELLKVATKIWLQNNEHLARLFVEQLKRALG